MERSRTEREQAGAAARGAVRRHDDAGGLSDERTATAQLAAQQARADASPRLAQLQEMEGMACAATVQRNDTGMPDSLKAGIESLSGLDMSAVRVHRNSDKPAQLNAHAYAQGTDIHLAPGQERHLPHEAWHVVQQMQQRVRPNGTVGQTPLNDDTALEKEATSMGEKAAQRKAAWNAGAPSGALTVAGLPAADRAPAQLQKIGVCDVYVDNANYPIWEQEGETWHLTMKDSKRWHVTTSDRGQSFWFEVDAGVVTPVDPTKKEYGSHKEKHDNLKNAPVEVARFITKHISEIIKVTEKVPKQY